VLRISKRPEPINLVHCSSCNRHEPFCYSRRHRPTPKNTLRGNPGCAVGPKTPTDGLELDVSPASTSIVVTGAAGASSAAAHSVLDDIAVAEAVAVEMAMGTRYPKPGEFLLY
jgi:hypothetical protein